MKFRVTDQPVPVALAATATAAVGISALYVASRANRTNADRLFYHLIVFHDNPKTGCCRNGKLILHPKNQPLSVLQTAVCAALQLDHVSLFLYDTKDMLTSFVQQQLEQHLRNSRGWRGHHVIPIIASESGTLSTDAASLSPVKPPPFGPRPLPMVGNALCGVRGPYDHPNYNFWYNLFRPELIEEWGETLCFELPLTPQQLESLKGHTDDPQALQVNIMTCDPDVVGELLDRQDDFPKTWNRPAELALTRLGKSGIFTSGTESEDWKTAHDLFPRAFNMLKVQQQYHPIILKKTSIFLESWSRYQPGHVITGINDWLGCMTADAVIKASCNVDMDNIKRRARGEQVHPILATYRRVGSISPATAKPWEVVGWFNYLNPFYDTKAGQERMFQELKGTLQELVDDVVEKSRLGELGDTLLTSFLNDKSPTTGKFVRQSVLLGQFVNLLVAGHETTANTMGFLMYYLTQNPQWEDRIRQEIRTVLGGRSELSPSDVAKLVVTEACFRETLRLHPPASQVGRDARYDTILLDKYLVRRGQRIQVNLVALHRNPRHWGGRFGDALAWNPERFMPGAAEATGRHPHAFKPFGFGVRACAGMQFALWEAKTLISMLYHHFTFKLAVKNFKLNPSRKESFPSPSAEGLALEIYPAPGAPDVIPRSAPSNSSSTNPAAAAAAHGTSASSAAAAKGSNNALPTAAAAGVHNTPLLVLYGSNSGTCEAFAAQVVDSAAAAGFNAAATPLDSYCQGGSTQLPKEGAVLVVTSTYNGLPPDNAVCFAKWLAAAGAGAAAGVPYAVLGVGNSQWVTYQAFPRLVDGYLSAAGGIQLSLVFECDTEAPGFTEGPADWWNKIRPILMKHFKVEAPGDESSRAAAPSSTRRLRIEPAPASVKAMHVRDVLQALKTMEKKVLAAAAVNSGHTGNGVTHPESVYSHLKIVAAEQLQAEGSSRFTRCVELELPEGVEYVAGDHLEVLPRNSPSLVDSALKLLNLSGTEVYNWTPNPQAAARGFSRQGAVAGKTTITDGMLNNHVDIDALVEPLPLSSRDILAWLVDLSAVPDRRTIGMLAESCPCPPEAAALKQLATEEVYKTQISGPKRTLLELLSKYQSLVASLDLPGLTALLPKLAPRYYSISSSPAAAGGSRRACITVGLVDYETQTGRRHEGAASSLIHRQQVGQFLAGTVRQLQSRFRLPADPSVPIIMVGPGTGVAPMIGFLEEREAQKKAGAAVGPSVLFFGCRSSTADYIYKARLEGWRNSGVLSDLQVAFSREPGQKKVYVQDLIAASGGKLWPLLVGQKAHVYVCGDARKMAPDVRAAFVQLAQQQGGMSAAAAEQWMSEMRDAGRYLEDVWAS